METEDQGKNEVVPPPMMITARPGELRIGPLLYDVLERVPLEDGEDRDDALRRTGWIRRYAWVPDKTGGAWTFGVKVQAS
jgi:hypothetical protein